MAGSSRTCAVCFFLLYYSTHTAQMLLAGKLGRLASHLLACLFSLAWVSMGQNEARCSSFLLAMSSIGVIGLAGCVDFHRQRFYNTSSRFFGSISVPSQRCFLTWVLVLLRTGAGWLSSFFGHCESLSCG